MDRSRRSPGIAVTKHTGAGANVRWRVPTVTLAIHTRLAELAPDPLETVSAAAAAWQGADPELPRLQVESSENPGIGFVQAGVNQNVITMAPEGFSNPTGALAMTILTFASDTGTIVDADIVIDGRRHGVSELEHDDHSETYDLQSIVTHELGHLLGLGEDTSDDQATMYYRLKSGDTSKRTLGDGDLVAIAAAYKHETPPTTEKRRTACAVGAPGSAVPWLAPAGAFLVLASLVAGRRRRLHRITAVALGLVAATAASLPARASKDTFVVSEAVSRWDRGLITTDLELTSRTQPSARRRVVVMGGSVGDFTQSVDGALVPAVGAAVTLARSIPSGGRLVPADLVRAEP